MAHLPNFSIEFLEDAADGLRVVRHPMWTLRCLISSRERLPRSLRNEVTFKELDVPGVYVLTGPCAFSQDADKSFDTQMYIGQSDSVAERLTSHLKNEKKQWWRTAVVLSLPEPNPLNLSHCRYLESRLCSLARDANKSSISNKVGPQSPSLSFTDQNVADEFLDKALLLLAAIGVNYFEREPPPPPLPPIPGPPENLIPLVEELRRMATAPQCPKAEWYYTFSPDYRAKVVSNGDFRVFMRVVWTKHWIWAKLADVGKYQLKNLADIDEQFRGAVASAYHKAELYLGR